ncbi:MAG: hypothetical protein ACRDRA_17285 [Pseudonocardiaceae bacterium]
MRLREHLADPWGALVAAVAGGLTWAVIPDVVLGLPLSIGVAAGVLGAKVAMGALVDRRAGAPSAPRSSVGDPADAPELPPYGSPARGWLDRAERAVRVLDELVGSVGVGITEEQLGAVRDGARGTVRAMRTLGARVRAFDQALARIDVDRLIAERTWLRTQLAGEQVDGLRAERQQAADSLGQQLEIHYRLASARDKLLARMQATALGLEGLSARSAELVALSASTGSTDTAEDQLIAELTADLDAMRAGLAEVDSLNWQPPESP